MNIKVVSCYQTTNGATFPTYALAEKHETLQISYAKERAERIIELKEARALASLALDIYQGKKAEQVVLEGEQKELKKTIYELQVTYTKSESEEDHQNLINALQLRDRNKRYLGKLQRENKELVVKYRFSRW